MYNNVISRTLTAELSVMYKSKKQPGCAQVEWLTALWMKGKKLQLRNLKGPACSAPIPPPLGLPDPHPSFISLSTSAHTSTCNARLGLRHLAMSFCLSLCHFPGESFPAVQGETRLPLVGPVPLLTHTQSKMICSMTFPPDHMGSLRVGPTLLIKA